MRRRASPGRASWTPVKGFLGDGRARRRSRIAVSERPLIEWPRPAGPPGAPFRRPGGVGVEREAEMVADSEPVRLQLPDGLREDSLRRFLSERVPALGTLRGAELIGGGRSNLT